jgi:hypothetical protein
VRRARLGWRVEFSPTSQVQQTVDVVSRNRAAMQQPG